MRVVERHGAASRLQWEMYQGGLITQASRWRQAKAHVAGSASESQARQPGRLPNSTPRQINRQLDHGTASRERGSIDADLLEQSHRRLAAGDAGMYRRVEAHLRTLTVKP